MLHYWNAVPVGQVWAEARGNATSVSSDLWIRLACDVVMDSSICDVGLKVWHSNSCVCVCVCVCVCHLLLLLGYCVFVFLSFAWVLCLCFLICVYPLAWWICVISLF